MCRVIQYSTTHTNTLVLATNITLLLYLICKFDNRIIVRTLQNQYWN